MLNTVLVKRMMENSKAGGLKQAFIIEAIRNYSERIVNGKPWDKGCGLNFEAWKCCAEECIEAIDNRGEA